MQDGILHWDPFAATHTGFKTMPKLQEPEHDRVVGHMTCNSKLQQLAMQGPASLRVDSLSTVYLAYSCDACCAGCLIDGRWLGR